MVRDYETPTIPPSWAQFARQQFDRLGFEGKTLSLVCSPDRYGSATVLRLYDASGSEVPYVRRSSDVRKAAEKRERFLSTARGGQYQTVEIDVAGYYVSEGIVPCKICASGKPHEEWQHVFVRELLRVKEQPPVPATLSNEEADEAETQALDQRVRAVLI